MWNDVVTATDSDGRSYYGKINAVSDQPEKIITESDIILLCLPGFMIEGTLRKILPYITNQAIGSIVSSTGFFFFAHDIFDKDTRLFGFQRVPYIARVEEYGKSARLLGYKSKLYMATENLSDEFIKQWSVFLNTPIEQLPSYLDASLSNSNPILHPSRLYALWHNWDGESEYPTNIRFYADWDDLSSEIYLECDKELQSLTRKLNVKVTPVLEYYECNNAKELTRKIRSIQAFQTIEAPMNKTYNGWKPDTKSRYFTEDFPYGLQIIKNLAEKNQIPTPTIDKVLAWGKQFI
jgi:hypothetical protein